MFETVSQVNDIHYLNFGLIYTFFFATKFSNSQALTVEFINSLFVYFLNWLGH